MLDAAELALIQSDAVAAVCDKTCQIWRDLTPTTPDKYGGSTSSPTNTANYTLMHTGVACGMAQPSAGELANYAYEIEDKDAWTVHMPVGTDVLERDHLVIEGQTLEVHILLQPQSYQALLSTICAQLR